MTFSDDDTDLAYGSVSVSGGHAGLGLTKEDRATTDQCIDRRVLLQLRRLFNAGTLTSLDGCIATGKEANVYAGAGSHGESLAVKIYKSAILVFKDRSRYIVGEHRMRGGTVRPGNNLNMVIQWAEKEYRNLLRLQKACVPCPKPIILRKNVLVMELVGSDDQPAPRLKDAVLSTKSATRMYRQMMTIMHAMYQDCRLVHADLSEYNILVHNEEPYIIDVSQSVEHDHPMAFEFLRMDCRNITNFFRKKGAACVSARILFQFVTDASLTTAEMVEDRIEALSRMDNSSEAEEDAVWEQTTVPRSLDELWDYDRQNSRKEIAESAVLKDALKRMAVIETSSEDEREDDDFLSSSSEDEGDSERSWVEKPEHLSKEQIRADRKTAKAQVKEERREKRKNKVPKKVKKRATKTGKHK